MEQGSLNVGTQRLSLQIWGIVTLILHMKLMISYQNTCLFLARVFDVCRTIAAPTFFFWGMCMWVCTAWKSLRPLDYRYDVRHFILLFSYFGAIRGPIKTKIRNCIGNGAMPPPYQLPGSSTACGLYLFRRLISRSRARRHHPNLYQDEFA